MPPLSVQEYAARVTAIIESATSIEAAVDAIAPLKKELLGNPDLLPPVCFEGLDSVNYKRNLLYCDPEGRFSILALVWNPQRESLVHDHENWGVVGTYTPGIKVTNYGPPAADGSMKETLSAILEGGKVIKIVPPRATNIHKMGNPGKKPVVTIHTYGDRALACRTFNPKTGETKDVQLVYHQVL